MIQKPLSNKFFGTGRLKNLTSLFFGAIGSFNLIHHGKLLLRNLIFYMDYVGGSETSIVDRQKYCLYKWDRVLECGELKDSDISDRNKLVIDIFRKYERAK